ncbi:MAG: helix-turn-helix domain-containing protein [Nitrospira sp.]|nr:helix-turn-helix domain-containing protein [Nitrospira sp.]
MAELLGVSKWTVYRWIDEGRLQATKIGGNSLRVFRSSVDKLRPESTSQQDKGTVVEQGSERRAAGSSFPQRRHTPRKAVRKRSSHYKEN